MLNVNDRNAIIAEARKFDKDNKGIVCLAESELILFTKHLAALWGVHVPPQMRSTDIKEVS